MKVSILIAVLFISACNTSDPKSDVMPENGVAPGQGAWIEYCEREKDAKLCQAP